jgi:hypothetical protein
LLYNHNSIQATIISTYHFLDIFEERDIADPPDFIDIDPREDIISTELGALLGKSMLLSFIKSSMIGPKSGKSSPKFLNSIRLT